MLVLLTEIQIIQTEIQIIFLLQASRHREMVLDHLKNQQGIRTSMAVSRIQMALEKVGLMQKGMYGFQQVVKLLTVENTGMFNPLEREVQEVHIEMFTLEEK